jgi:hypothetical protein
VAPYTNPIESIINSVTALKAFDFATALTSSNGVSQMDFIESVPEGITANQRREAADKEEEAAEKSLSSEADKEALRLFARLSDGFVSQAKLVYEAQQTWAGKFVKDLQAMSDYLVPGNFRGPHYKDFAPQVQLKSIYGDTQFAMAEDPPQLTPSELDWASLQAVDDQLKNIQTHLLANCTANKGPCDASLLKYLDQRVDQANALVQNAQDNLKILQADQAAVVTAYQLIVKIYGDFQNRLKLGTLTEDKNNGVLTQDISLPTDYEQTDPFTITCVNDATTTSATTDAMNLSILYQNVPALTANAGILLSTLNLQLIGVQQELVSGVSVPYFAVTQSSHVEVVPMAYVNYRFLKPKLTTVWGQPETELVRAHSVSGGIGVNSNSGTNQPEFFAGYALSFNRVYLHFGADFSRNETLGGGFTLNQPTPTGFTGTTAPIDWKYQTVFGFGLSVRVAPF